MLCLAEGFGMETVTESVETKAEADMLKKFGVDYFQDYLSAKPKMDAPIQRQGEAVSENEDEKVHGGGSQT